MDIDSIEKLLDGYHDLEDNEQEEFLKNLLAVANRDPEKFKAAVASLSFDPDHSNLEIVYDALSEDMDNWGLFFLDELKRILTLAEQSANPKDFLWALSDLAIFEPEANEHYDEMLAIIAPVLKHTDAVFRYHALSFVYYILKEGDRHGENLMINMLDDNHWIIRREAHENCKNWEILPEGRTLSLMDRIRAMFMNKYELR